MDHLFQNSIENLTAFNMIILMVKEFNQSIKYDFQFACHVYQKCKENRKEN